MTSRKLALQLRVAAVVLMVPWPAIAADYLGKVTSVADGDTFTMESETGKVRVRICGIDAPERGQPGYGQAAGVLANMIEGKTVHCLQVGEGTVCDGKSKPNNRDRSRSELERVSVALLANEMPLPKPVRLLGVSLSSLQGNEDEEPQLGLPI